MRLTGSMVISPIRTLLREAAPARGPGFVALACLLAGPALADPPALSLPLDCQIGQTCYIEDYLDNDPAPGKQLDFACGSNSRDAHKGTDFALLSLDLNTTDVLASAPGTVLRIRDSMADDRLMRGVTDENACGNAVLLDHGDGWQTLYCHMALGSLAVRPGQQVARGTPLGRVGMSGQSNHPHVHLSVMHDGAEVDPFRPEATGTCGDPGPTLWQVAPPYTPTRMVTAGFSDAVPEMEAVRSGSARLDSASSQAPLVVYTLMTQAQHGDLLVLRATGPQGEVFDRSMVLKAPQLTIMRAAGRKAPPGGWPSGDYIGEATLTRKGAVIAHRWAYVTVP